MTDRASWIDNPSVEVRQIGGFEYKFDRHHVIATNVYEKFVFLEALERTGLFVQNSFSSNGLYLVSEYREVGSTEWKSITTAPDAVRAQISGAAHTGGHSSYDAAQTAFFSDFNDAYRAEKANFLSSNPNSTFEGSLAERAFLERNVGTVVTYTNVLKVELVNPDSALKLHGSDDARIDLTSRSVWLDSPSALLDPTTLKLRDEVLQLKSAQIAGIVDGSWGSGSVIDRNSETRWIATSISIQPSRMLQMISAGSSATPSSLRWSDRSPHSSPASWRIALASARPTSAAGSSGRSPAPSPARC